MNSIRTLLVLGLMTVPASWVLAHGPGEGRGPPRPPPEAYAACEDASEGEACSVELPEDTVTGRCRPDAAQVLYCHPDRPPPRRPPPEAFAACAEHAEGDACTVQTHGHTLEGTCVRREASEALHCRPAHPPPPPPH